MHEHLEGGMMSEITDLWTMLASQQLLHELCISVATTMLTSCHCFTCMLPLTHYMHCPQLARQGYVGYFSGALRPDSRKCRSYLQNCLRFWLQIINGDSLGIASFVGVTTPTCDIITVNKFPRKFAHSYNKLSLRRPSSTFPNWLCVSYIVDIQLQMPFRWHNSA